MMTLEQLQQLVEQDDLDLLDQHLLPMDTAVIRLPQLVLTEEQTKAVGFGQRVKFVNAQRIQGQVRLISPNNLFLGVAIIDEHN
ncbi:tRNA pseudouridine(55) synthase TruB, partial [Oceanobacillus profundus]